MQFSDSLGNLGLFKEAAPPQYNMYNFPERSLDPPDYPAPVEGGDLKEYEIYDDAGEEFPVMVNYSFTAEKVAENQFHIEVDIEDIWDGNAWKQGKKILFDFEAHGLDEFAKINELKEEIKENV